MRGQGTQHAHMCPPLLPSKQQPDERDPVIIVDDRIYVTCQHLNPLALAPIAGMYSFDSALSCCACGPRFVSHHCARRHYARAQPICPMPTPYTFHSSRMVLEH